MQSAAKADAVRPFTHRSQGLRHYTRIGYNAALRHLLTIVSIISLLLCMGIIAAWVRSEQIADVFGLLIDGKESGGSYAEYAQLMSGKGTVSFGQQWYSMTGTQRLAEANSGRLRHSTILLGNFAVSARDLWEDLGFRVYRWRRLPPGARQRRGAISGVRVPYWSLFLLTATLPAQWLFLWYRRQLRSKAGCCVQCGYDLLDNTSGACPECGLVVEH